MNLADDDYRRLLDAVEGRVAICEVCGAWLDYDDTRLASLEDFVGCWWGATRREQDRATCVREARAPRPSTEAEGKR